MYVTATWIALLTVSALIEIWSRVRPARTSTLSRTGSMIARSISGRAILIALWIFVGLHLFARYTVPNH